MGELQQAGRKEGKTEVMRKEGRMQVSLIN